MPTNRVWKGGAQAAQDVYTVTVTAAAIGGTITVHFPNGKDVVYNCTGTNVSVAAAELGSRISAYSLEPEIAEVTVLVAGADVLLYGPPDGRPWGPPTKTDAGGMATTVTHTQTGTGASHADVAANWSPAGLPAATDNIHFDAGSQVDCLWKLDALAAVAPGKVQTAGYRGHVGLPEIAGGTTGQGRYPEYRPRYLKFALAGSLNVGVGDTQGQGPARFNFDFAAAAGTANVYASGNPPGDENAVRLLGGAVAAVNVFGGDVAVAPGAGETSQVGSFATSGSNQSRASLFIGEGVVVTGASRFGGGDVVTLAPLTLPLLDGGTLTILGGATMTDCVINSGTLYWNSSGNWTLLSIHSGGEFNLTRETRPHTSGLVTVHFGGKFLDDNRTVAAATEFSFPDGLENITVRLGRGVSLQKV